MMSPEFVSVNTDLVPLPTFPQFETFTASFLLFFALYGKILFLDRPQERVAVSQVWDIVGFPFDFEAYCEPVHQIPEIKNFWVTII